MSGWEASEDHMEWAVGRRTWWSQCGICGARFTHSTYGPTVGQCDMDFHQRSWDYEDQLQADPLGLTLEAFRARRRARWAKEDSGGKV